MTAVSDACLMTSEQFLALPDDGVERDLIRGRVRVYGRTGEGQMTRRGMRHTWAGTNVAFLLRAWVKSLPAPRGRVLTGEAAFRLRQNPDTLVGIDVAYISAQLAAAVPADTFSIDGVPVLAVEILSPSDTQETITAKIADYLAAGVSIVWIVEPVFQTVTVYCADAPPVMFNVTQQLHGDPHLPGFRADVAEVFGD